MEEMQASFDLRLILQKEDDNLPSLTYKIQHSSPQGGSPPGGSTSPEAHIPTGNTGCWTGTGCTPGPSHLFGRCGSPPTEPGIHCWWCPRYPSPGCCLAPASRRRPGAPSAATPDTMAKIRTTQSGPQHLSASYLSSKMKTSCWNCDVC